MAVTNATAPDSRVDGYISAIKSAKFGSDTRVPIANAVDRCYAIARNRIGRTIVPHSAITEHTNRIKNAVFGEEVRDALKTGLTLCYRARGINVSSNEDSLLNNLIEAQTGEDLKNYIIESIARCCRDVLQ